MVLMRLTVCESPSGVCLFDKTWAWHSAEQPGSADGICSLVLALAKLTRDIGGVASGCTLFDPAAALPPLAAQLRGTRKPPAAPGVGRVRLAFERRERIAVGVFHDAADDPGAVADFLATAARRFESIYGAVIAAMRPRFEQVERSDGQVTLSADELRPFAPFAEVADKLRAEAAVPGASPSPSSASAAAAPTPSGNAPPPS